MIIQVYKSVENMSYLHLTSTRPKIDRFLANLHPQTELTCLVRNLSLILKLFDNLLGITVTQGMNIEFYF
jgi:hypothetical protein